MTMSAAVSMVGLAALVALLGQPTSVDEGSVPGAGSLYVTVEEKVEEDVGDLLSVGDQVEYTIKVRNAGYEALPEAQIVQFLPSSMRYVSGAPGAVETGQAVWEQPLEPGERAVHTVTAEIAEVPEGASQPVSTFCLRPAAGADLAACTSSVHHVKRQSPVLWVAAGLGLVVSAVFAVVGCLRRRRDHGSASGQEPLNDDAPDSGADLPTLQGEASVYQLDAHR